MVSDKELSSDAVASHLANAAQGDGWSSIFSTEQGRSILLEYTLIVLSGPRYASMEISPKQVRRVGISNLSSFALFPHFDISGFPA